MSIVERLRLGLGQYGGMTKDAKLLIGSNMAGSVYWGFIMVIQSIYLKSIGVDEVTIGLLYMISGVVGAATVIPFGILSDRYGRKQFLVFGGFLSTLFPAIYVLTTSVPLFFLAGVSSSIGGAMWSAPYSALLAEKSTDEKRTALFSLSWFSWSGPSTLGALLSGIPDFLMTEAGFDVVSAYRPLFILATISSLASTIILLPIKENGERYSSSGVLPRKSARVIAKFAVANALVGFGAGFIVPLFSLWFFLRFGIGGSLLGPLFAVTNAVTAVTYLLAPKLAKSVGTVNSVVITQLASTLVLLAIPLTTSYGAAAVMYVVRNFLMNMSGPIQSSYMMAVVSPDERASCSSIVSMPFGIAWAVPNSLSQSFGGYLLKQGWLSLPFYLCGACYTASSGLFLAFFRKLRPPEEKD